MGAPDYDSISAEQLAEWEAVFPPTPLTRTLWITDGNDKACREFRDHVMGEGGAFSLASLAEDIPADADAGWWRENLGASGECTQVGHTPGEVGDTWEIHAPGGIPLPAMLRASERWPAIHFRLISAAPERLGDRPFDLSLVIVLSGKVVFSLDIDISRAAVRDPDRYEDLITRARETLERFGDARLADALWVPALVAERDRREWRKADEIVRNWDTWTFILRGEEAAVTAAVEDLAANLHEGPEEMVVDPLTGADGVVCWPWRMSWNHPEFDRETFARTREDFTRRWSAENLSVIHPGVEVITFDCTDDIHEADFSGFRSGRRTMDRTLVAGDDDGRGDPDADWKDEVLAELRALGVPRIFIIGVDASAGYGAFGYDEMGMAL